MKREITMLTCFVVAFIRVAIVTTGADIHSLAGQSYKDFSHILIGGLAVAGRMPGWNCYRVAFLTLCVIECVCAAASIAGK